MPSGFFLYLPATINTIIMRFELPLLLALTTATSAWVISGYTSTTCDDNYDDDDYGSDNEHIKTCIDYSDQETPILAVDIDITQGNVWLYSPDTYNCTGGDWVTAGPGCSQAEAISWPSIGGVLYWSYGY